MTNGIVLFWHIFTLLFIKKIFLLLNKKAINFDSYYFLLKTIANILQFFEKIKLNGNFKRIIKNRNLFELKS